ncbi:uncharacterized protein IUM83_13659 [Phytophthora cinnamomi]|uniref:uncharacterized protein n=1 Tax=Phytophthora cinnamomi TaxID=4785 RepID=UPI0035599DD5|nr:hypothetical protein IUM83_13659 [Phytophthora cinnamomi]
MCVSTPPPEKKRRGRDENGDLVSDKSNGTAEQVTHAAYPEKLKGEMSARRTGGTEAGRSARLATTTRNGRGGTSVPNGDAWRYWNWDRSGRRLCKCYQV